MSSKIRKIRQAPPSLAAYWHEQFRRFFPDVDQYRREQAPLLEVVFAARPG